MGIEMRVPLDHYGSRVNSASDGRLASAVLDVRAERKLATILFTDIERSMELSASVELDDWWSVMCRLFDLMCDGVHRFGGWIGNFTGDGMYAVFEDQDHGAGHAARSCDAALWLREAIKTPVEQLQRERGLQLAVRTGMHSGEILTGAIGRQRTRYYVASGFAVSLAKRIEGLAVPGRIYISEHTARLLRPEMRLRDLGAFAVKGSPLPVGVFELVASGA